MKYSSSRRVQLDKVLDTILIHYRSLKSLERTGYHIQSIHFKISYRDAIAMIFLFLP